MNEDYPNFIRRQHNFPEVHSYEIRSARRCQVWVRCAASPMIALSGFVQENRPPGDEIYLVKPMGKMGLDTVTVYRVEAPPSPEYSITLI